MSRRTRAPLGRTIGESTPTSVVAPIILSPRAGENIQSILSQVNINGQALFNYNQINKLINIKLSNSSPLFDIDDRSSIYELISIIAKEGYDITYAFLLSKKWKDIKEVILQSPSMKSAQDKLILDLQMTQSQIEVIEGLYTCRRCQSKKTQSTSQQTRSADEPATIIVTCIVCQYTWKVQ